MSSVQLKREGSGTSKSAGDTKKSKIICSYKEKCFRRNPHHFKEYSHPHLETLLDIKDDDIDLPEGYVERPILLEQLKILRELRKPSNESWENFHSENKSSDAKLTMADKMKRNGPFNIFFTTIPEAPETEIQANSITITDLLCPSLGVLESSLQINFMIDIVWLMEQYYQTNNHKKALTILYGEDFPKMKEYMAKYLPNVTPHFVKMQDPFGTHHSKIGIYSYADRSLRIHVSTANLYKEDWSVYCQALWLSPCCPPLPSDAPDTAGESSTGFKSALIAYLRHYQVPCLSEWIRRVKRTDFSSVRVFLVTSVPGKHSAITNGGHLNQVGDLLSRHCVLPEDPHEGPLSWSVIAQASSIGNLGQTPAAWLRGGMLRSLASHKRSKLPANSQAHLNVVFPSKRNVLSSYHGENGGGCLPYSRSVHEKQKWLETYLHEWRADTTGRTRAMPHIKSYCRVSPCLQKLAYFLLTSANISKAAWGSLNKDLSSYVRSYECGVLFLPSFFDQDYFYIGKPGTTISVHGEQNPVFPFVYDLPLSQYKSSDKPWCM